MRGGEEKDREEGKRGKGEREEGRNPVKVEKDWMENMRMDPQMRRMPSLTQK